MLKDDNEVYLRIHITRAKVPDKELSRNTHHGMKVYHSHNFFEIGYKEFKDKRTYTIDGVKYRYDSNCIVMAPPGKKHLTSREKVSYRFLAECSEELVNEVFLYLGADIEEFKKNFIYYFNDEKMNKIKMLGEEMNTEYMLSKGEKVRKNYRLKILFTEFIAMLLEPDLIVQPEGNEENTIDLITDYLKKNYNKQITLSLLSEKFYINKYVMCRKFKERTGMTVMDFLGQIRNEYACRMLTETKLSVSEIAQRTGYSNVDRFYENFKKRMLVSPMKYRKNSVNNMVDQSN